MKTKNISTTVLFCFLFYIGKAQLNLDIPYITPNPAIICSNEKAILTANSLLNYTQFKWYQQIDSDSAIFEGSTFVTPNLDSTTAYYLTSVDFLGNESIRTAALVIVRPALNLAIVNPNPGIVCVGNSITFTASATAPFESAFWYHDVLDTTPFFIGNEYTIDQVLTSDDFFVSVTDSNGCESIKTPLSLIASTGADLLTFDAADTVICSGNKTSVTAFSTFGNSRFKWYSAPNDTNPFYEGNTLQTPILYSNTTYWVASVDSMNCHSSKFPVLIPVISNPDSVSVSIPANICINDTISVEAISSLNYTNFNWYANVLDTIIVSQANPFDFEANDSISYWYVSSVDNIGCKSNRTTVEIHAKPKQQLFAPVLNCLPSSVFWESVPYADFYAYSFDTITWIATNNLEIIANNQVFVRSESSASCVDSPSEIASIHCLSINNSAVPNIITPNGDGYNDFWILPSYIANQSNNLEIVNEAGNLIYQKQNYSNKEDLFGEENPVDGIYLYRIILNGNKEQITGTLIVKTK